jgi:small multidrug resistance family-3 protein
VNATIRHCGQSFHRKARLMTWLTYLTAAFFEIAGCFAFWSFLRNDKHIAWLIPGLACLIAFAALLTRIETDAAGRAFAAYGGIYIAASLIWLWLVEEMRPDVYDLMGAGLSIAGALVIVLAPRAA